MLLFIGLFTIAVSFVILCFNTPKTMLFLAVLALLFIWSRADAADNSGNYRLEGCMAMETLVTKNLQLPKNPMLAYRMGICTGQTNTALFILSEIACVPKTVTVGQFITMMNKFLKEHPEKRNEDFNNIMAYVAMEKWPCKQSPAKGEQF